LNPVHDFTPCFLKIHCNIFFPSIPSSSKLFSPQVFPTRLTGLSFSSMVLQPCCPLFDHANKNIWGGSTLCSFLQPFTLPSQAVPSISCSNLKLCSSFRVTFPPFPKSNMNPFPILVSSSCSVCLE
jgi:hypothetical protein